MDTFLIVAAVMVLFVTLLMVCELLRERAEAVKPRLLAVKLTSDWHDAVVFVPPDVRVTDRVVYLLGRIPEPTMFKQGAWFGCLLDLLSQEGVHVVGSPPAQVDRTLDVELLRMGEIMRRTGANVLVDVPEVDAVYCQVCGQECFSRRNGAVHHRSETDDSGINYALDADHTPVLPVAEEKV